MSSGACVRKFVDYAVVGSRVILVCLALVACSGIDDDNVLADDDPVGATAVLNHVNHIDIAGYMVGIYAGKIYDAAILTGEVFVAGSEPNGVEILDP